MNSDIGIFRTQTGKRHIGFVCGLLLGSLNGLLFGQASYRFNQLSLKNGLSQGMVTCLLQDRRGFIWVGTKDGLNRFDGYDFEIYRALGDDPNSLSDSYITALTEGADGKMWVGTNEGGLNVYDPVTERFSHYRHQPGKPGLCSDFISALFSDRKGQLWIGTKDAGVDVFDPLQKTFRNWSHRDDGSELHGNDIGVIVEGGQGRIWLSTRTGLHVLDPQKGVIRYFQQVPSETSEKGFPWIRAMAPRKAGGIWAATDWGLYLFHANGRITPYQLGDSSGLPENVYGLSEKNGELWVARYSDLNRMPLGRGPQDWQPSERIRPEQNEGPFSCMLIDRNGLIWLGSPGFGVFFLDPTHPFESLLPKSDFKDNYVYSVLQTSGGQVWVGTGTGLVILDEPSGTRRVLRHVIENKNAEVPDSIWCLREARNGVVWAGTKRGLARLAGASWQEGQFKDFETESHPTLQGFQNCVSILENDNPAQDRLWIATDAGLRLIDPKQGTLKLYRHDPKNPFSLGSNTITVLLAGLMQGKKVIWIGTNHAGLNACDPETGKFIRFPANHSEPDSLSNNHVLSLYQDPDGLLWVGTRGGGLNLFDPHNGTFRHYRKKDGLPNNTIYAILPDEKTGRLWLSTNKGLACFDPASAVSRNYSFEDGLQADEFNTGAYFRSPQGKLFFGGIDGLNAFFPELIGGNALPPDVVITGFLLANKPITPRSGNAILSSAISETASITLPYDQNVFSFRFTATSYAASNKNQYAYKMEGFDEGWTQTSSDNRVATYTNLAGDDYVFRVRGANSDGVWNSEGTRLEIRMEPPPWKTWWAYCLYVMALAGLIFSYLASQARIQRILADQIEAKTRNLRETHREMVELAHRTGMAEIASEVLHGLGNVLNSMVINTQLIQEKAADRFWEKRLVRVSSWLHLRREGLANLTGGDSEMSAAFDALDKISENLSIKNDSFLEHSRALGLVLDELRSLLQSQEGYTISDQQMETGDINQIVRDSLEIESHLFEEQGIDLRLDLHEVRRVSMEPIKMRLTLLCLLENAREAVVRESTGRPKEVRLETREESGAVIFKLEDSGAGIPEDQIELTYRRGYSTKPDGRGLGLHYAANTMKRFRGQIEIKNLAKGSGTRVQLHFPPGEKGDQGLKSQDSSLKAQGSGHLE